MWKPRAMTSLRVANSPSSASAGGQEEHPCEVNNSTTVGRVSAWLGDAADTSPRQHNTAAHATRCNATAASRLRSDPQDMASGRAAARTGRITSACGASVVSGVPGRLCRDKPCDQAVDLAGFFHMRQVARLVEDVDRHAAGEGLGMGDRDDAVVAAPDQLDRHPEAFERGGEPDALYAAREPFLGDRLERGLDAV